MAPFTRSRLSSSNAVLLQENADLKAELERVKKEVQQLRSRLAEMTRPNRPSSLPVPTQLSSSILVRKSYARCFPKCSSSTQPPNISNCSSSTQPPNLSNCASSTQPNLSFPTQPLNLSLSSSPSVSPSIPSLSRLASPWQTPPRRHRFSPSHFGPQYSQSQSLPLTTQNSFHSLSSSNSESSFSTPPMNRQSPQAPRVQPARRPAPSCRPSNKKRNVVVIGDSHVRGCVDLLQETLGSQVAVTASLMPGAPASQFSSLIASAASWSSPEDVIVVVGGTNRCREDLPVYEKRLRAVLPTVHNPVFFVDTPHRYDDPSQNYYIDQANRAVDGIIAGFPNVSRFSLAGLDRSHSTRHGLHLNHRGKRILCSQIADGLKAFLF